MLDHYELRKLLKQALEALELSQLKFYKVKPKFNSTQLYKVKPCIEKYGHIHRTYSMRRINEQISHNQPTCRIGPQSFVRPLHQIARIWN